MRGSLNGFVRHPELSAAAGASQGLAGENPQDQRKMLRVRKISNCSTLSPDLFRCAAAVKKDNI